MIKHMNVHIEQGWKNILAEVFNQKFFKELITFIRHEYMTKTIYPEAENIFHAFNKTPFHKVSVVIIGQDPYHNPEQAHGLCFSVTNSVTPPPSLKNIYKEIENDLDIHKDFTNGNLESWAHQGVLLLNSVLTVEKNKPGSHTNKGWEKFTDAVIKKISDEKEHCVFILWGKYAQQKGVLIDRTKHLLLESAHPSPFSAHRGFLGNKHFSQTNAYLKKHGKQEIAW